MLDKGLSNCGSMHLDGVNQRCFNFEVRFGLVDELWPVLQECVGADVIIRKGRKM
jgi:hypothetical protein